jgi:hypothetical protein
LKDCSTRLVKSLADPPIKLEQLELDLSFIIIFRVKYIFVPLWFYDFIFFPCDLFRIVHDTSFMATDRDDTSVQTSVQKLTEVHVNTSKKLTRVICLIKN